MRAVQQTQTRAAQTQRISPRLVAAGAVLVMSSEELQLHIEQEVALNPALEIVWESQCPVCGRGMANGLCWQCRFAAAHNGEAADRISDAPLPRFPPGDDGDSSYNPLENLQRPASLQEHVLLQARLVLGPGDLAIAEYLVGTLDDDGLLRGSPEEAARALGVELPRVEAVLSRLQGLDPPGVCARSAQESVLIQLRELAAEGPVPVLVEPMIRDHWHDLANHAYAKIARALQVSPEDVEEALAFVRESLYPYPGRLYHPSSNGEEEPQRRIYRPDVIVRRDLADYVVEVVTPFDFELRVSEAYRRLHLLARAQKEESPEYRLAMGQYHRATWLLQSLSLREQTLRQIAELLVAYQRPFLDTGSRDKLKPLTRTEVARHIGKHLSTVSRATAGKFILLPNGDLVSFDHFFTPAEAPKSVVAELLSHEDPERPLTDEQIARILRLRGFRIARRTVAKYRLALRQPSSVQRGRR